MMNEQLAAENRANGLYTLYIGNYAYIIPMGTYYSKYVVTHSNIQLLPNINIILDGLGMNTDKYLAEIELKSMVRVLRQDGIIDKPYYVEIKE